MTFDFLLKDEEQTCNENCFTRNDSKSFQEKIVLEKFW